MRIKTNSKKVTNGDTFIAIRGLEHDGHNYIKEAINNGATTIICEEGEYSVDTVIVNNTKEYLNNYLHTHYYNEISDIKLVGITGTNGKTTSCYILYELLKLLGIKCAYIGTIGFYIDSKVKDLDNTTPELLELYEMFLKCKNNKVEIIVMEVSSHALSLDRVYGLKYDYVVFTNLTEDHLLFHNGIENYLDSKKKLFTKLKSNGVSIVNIDDEYGKHFIVDDTITYGIDDSNYKIMNYKLYIDKTIYKIKVNNKVYKIKVNIPSKYNIYNSLISIIVLNKMGYRTKNIKKLLTKVTLPSGRMDTIRHNKKVIIIDYAHTPDAVKNVLSNGNEFKKGNIYTIIGCGGNRDNKKRSEMGKIATDLSDYVIFTNDNPRDEDEKLIINDIISNLDNDNYEVIFDRREAIRTGMDILSTNDILFILGKGHEDYQIIKEIKYHFSDKEEVKNYIKGKCIIVNDVRQKS